MTTTGRVRLLRRSVSAVDRRPGPLLWVRLYRVVLWMLVIAGPLVAGVLAVKVAGLSQRVEVVSRQSVPVLPAEKAGVEGFAELFVAAYLNADKGTVPLVGSLDARSLRVMEEGSWWAFRTVSLGAQEVGTGYFAVTVAAEIVARDDPTSEVDEPVWGPVGVRFYTVGVVETDSGWALVGLPSLVAAPPIGPSSDLLVGRLDGLADIPGLEEAAIRFLAAYLAGEGELTRYTAPGSHLVPVQPAPFVSVEILQAGSTAMVEGAREVVAVVEGRDEVGRSQILQYGLVMAEREGRWEVVELLAAPSLAEGSND